MAIGTRGTTEDQVRPDPDDERGMVPAGGAAVVATTRDRSVAVIGLGYTGLPLAVSFVESGLRVAGIDSFAGRVAELNARTSPIDDISDARLSAALDAGMVVVSPTDAELEAADAVFVCVPTPITATKDPDLSPVLEAAAYI